MILSRFIPTLLLSKRGLHKTTGFDQPRYIGDPINVINIYNEKQVDELMLFDIDAHRTGEIAWDILTEVAGECFMPICYGGGLTNLDDVKRVFDLGIEKISINSAVYRDINLLRRSAEMFGVQSVTATIDYRSNVTGTAHCYSHGGSIRHDVTPLEQAKKLVDNGAGEIVLYDIMRDGARTGYDLETLSLVSKSVDVPVVCCGGARDLNDLRQGLLHGAAACAAGSLFCYIGPLQAVLITYPSANLLEKVMEGAALIIKD